jgi:Spy/CpxP family protein refolding chaperone
LHLKQTTTKHIETMKTKTTIALLAAIGAIALTASAQDNTPPAGGPPDGQSPGQHMGGPGGARGGMHILPPPLMQQLKLTDDQKTQIAALEAETKAKLEKILTAEQLQQLKNFRPPMRGGMGGQQHGGNGPEGGDNSRPPGPPAGDQ